MEVQKASSVDENSWTVNERPLDLHTDVNSTSIGRHVDDACPLGGAMAGRGV